MSLPVLGHRQRTSPLLSRCSQDNTGAIAGLLPVFLLLLAAPLVAQESSELATTSPVKPGAEVRLLAHTFKFTEGPIANDAGDVFFTDQPNDRILKWSADGKLSTFLQPCGRSNGLYRDRDGSLLACADENNEIWSIQPNTEHTVVLSGYHAKRLNGPNDLWVRPDGGIYFTDPFYPRPYWKHDTSEQDGQCVYFLDSSRKRLMRVDDKLVQPNGIVGSLDGKTLFVSDISDKKTYVYDIQADGTLSNRRLFCALGSDGMTIDNAGNLYLTGKGVTIFAPDGKQIQNIPVPEAWTANVCFGGPKHQTLFITACKGLYSLEMQTAGRN